MQDLENDMEDLFQRAADNYPLQEGKGDWENIAKRISDNPASAEAIVPERKRNNKKFIALVLLVFIIAAGWFLVQNTRSGYSSLRKTEPGNGTEKISGLKTVDNKLRVTGKEQIPGVNENKKAGNYKKSITISSKVSSVTNSKIGNGSFYSKNNNTNQNEDDTAHNGMIEKYTNPNDYLSIPQLIKQNGQSGVQERRENTIPEFSEYIEVVTDNPASVSLKNFSKQKENSDSSEKTKKEIQAYAQKKGGTYIGIIIGPDFSKVQPGSFSNTGFDAGVLLGFRFHRKLSLETGLLWNRKIYSSEGKDFSMDKVGATMPTGMVIDNLKSHSSLIEVPIKLKYDFIVKNSSALFATAGISSYIMTKEMNTYYVTHNGNPEKLLGVYKRNNYRLPAVANLSIGYEYSVSKNLDLRIEPFLKIPLQGMGVGSLPVTSAGLQLGITGRLK